MSKKIKKLNNVFKNECERLRSKVKTESICLLVKIM